MYEPKFPKPQKKEKAKRTPLPKPKKRIRQKSGKLAKAEKNRKPLNGPMCWVSGSPLDLEKHEIFGGSNRQASMEWGMVVYLSHAWHEKMKVLPALCLILQRWGQRKFLRMNPNIDFVSQFGKNYLEVEWEGNIDAEVLRELSNRHGHDEDFETTLREYRESQSECRETEIS